MRAGQVQQSPGDLSHGGRGRRGSEEEGEREEKEEKREKDGEAVSESRGALVPRWKG